MINTINEKSSFIDPYTLIPGPTKRKRGVTKVISLCRTKREECTKIPFIISYVNHLSWCHPVTKDNNVGNWCNL